MILVVDAGTSTIRASIVDEAGSVVARAMRPMANHSPAPGRSEFDPAALVTDALDAIHEATAGGSVRVDAVAVTTQRSSTVAWDADTLTPIGPGLGWQDTRTLYERSPSVPEDVLLVPNQAPAKVRWLLDNCAEATRPSTSTRAGTVDTWLIAALSEGSAHVTDPSQAMTAGWFDPTAMEIDRGLLDAIGISYDVAPAVADSCASPGTIAIASAIPGSPPITAVVADQQASMLGHGCSTPGSMKATFGTSGAVDVCLGSSVPTPTRGTFPIIAWSVDGALTWALEGIMLGTGAGLDWIVDLGLASSLERVDELAARSGDDDVWFVPAMYGLATPAWDLSARATLVGLTRGTTGADVAAAVVRGLAHLAADVLDAVAADAADNDHTVNVDAPLPIDGGVTRCSAFVSELATVTGRPIEVSATEPTTTGAAELAWRGLHGEPPGWARASSRLVEPELGRAGSPDHRRDRWRDALARSRALEQV